MKIHACYIVAGVLAMVLSASTVQAEEMGKPMPGKGMMQKGAEDPDMAANRKEEEELRFKNRKEEMLLEINNRIESLTKKKSCLEAANTREDMQKCQPMGMGGGSGPSHGGGGGMGGGETPPPSHHQ